MAQWASLPNEIQAKILGHLFDSSNPSNDKGGLVGRPLQRRRACREYLTTCKNWKAILEPLVYRHLFLTQYTLPLLWRISRRQQALVRHVWLAIKLPRYRCPECPGARPWDGHPEVRTREGHRLRVNDTVIRLFWVLSSWETERRPADAKLTLEISVFSESDAEHAFGNHLHLDSSPFTPPGAVELRRPRLSDTGHGWYCGRRSRPYTLKSIRVITACTTSGYALQRLPVVPVVDAFVIRRQTRRQLPGTTLVAMARSLPNITSMLFEPWGTMIGFPTPDTYPGDAEYSSIIHQCLSPALKDLILFEDFNEDFCRVYTENPFAARWRYPPELYRTPSALVAHVLANRSRSLQTLAASYLIDARDFFTSPIDATSTWPTLTSLYLTSRQLVPGTDGAEINDLLAIAGQVALRMPVLHTMVIWYGAQDVAGEFRFEVSAAARRASVRWRGTFSHRLGEEALAAWQKVAEVRTGCSLIVRQSQKLDQVYSHGAAIRALGLGGHVIHPVSLEQVCGETSRYWFK